MAGSGRPRRWIRPSSTCEPAVSASRASSVSEALGLLGAALGPDADEHDALEAQLPVLDLGDVGELGGEPGDAAQRAALLEVERRRPTGRRLDGRGRVEAAWTGESSVIVGGILPRATLAASRRIPVAPVRLGVPSHQSAASSPDATSTAGPCSTVVSSRDRDPQASARACAPRRRRSSRPAARSAATTAATVPVPHERVSPTPRSCTRIATSPVAAPAETNSTFTPCGNSAGS